MTTIACNRTIMAADTRVSTLDVERESVHIFSSIKIERVGKSLVGSSGDFKAGVRFMEWMYAGMPKKAPRLCKEFAALRLDDDGTIWYTDQSDLVWVRVDEPFYAIGSGSRCALGAMSAGANPAQAVEIAKKWDAFSGGEVTVMKVAADVDAATGSTVASTTKEGGKRARAKKPVV